MYAIILKIFIFLVVFFFFPQYPLFQEYGVGTIFRLLEVHGNERAYEKRSSQTGSSLGLSQLIVLVTRLEGV